MTELVTDPVHKSHDDEYFDGNDVKSYHAQGGGEHYPAKSSSEIQEEEAAGDESHQDLLERFDGNENMVEGYLQSLKQLEESTRQQQEAEKQVQMQAVAGDVVARYDAKTERLEDAKDVVEDAFEESGMTEAGRRWLAENMPEQPVVAPQEEVILPRPASESANEKPASKLGMFESRRMDASRSVMNQMANAASELANSPGLTEEERTKYAEDAKRYSGAVTDLVMGSRPALSKAELQGNEASLGKLENKLLKNKNERGIPLSKDEKKRLSKLK